MSPYPQQTADLVTFPEEILTGKLHFCAVKVVMLPVRNEYRSIPLGRWT